jgi:3-oxoacyl-[acyl-carrier-protein] synthase II
MRRRIVVTGLGLCTPVGSGPGDFWPNLLAGRSGIGPITRFAAGALPVRIGGEVKGLDLPAFPEVEPGDDRKVRLGLAAARQALCDAGLAEANLEPGLVSVGVCLEFFSLERVAPVAGAADMIQALARQWQAGAGGPPLQIPLDCLTQQLGKHYRFRRGWSTNCSACAAGAQAVGEAFQRLREGEAELALAGAADSTLNPLGLGGFSLLRILAQENDRPQAACRPFDATRQGTVLSEGAAFLVLETEARARQRGARIYAEITGYATSLDAYRVSDPEPSGRGAARCMSQALADAGLAPEAIDSINAHGTGTPKNDLTETQAIKQVFGEHARRIPVYAIKSMTGHMIAASGAVEAAAACLSLYTGRIPPTINLQHPDPLCDLDYVAGQARDFAGRTVLSNSFGFGGQNAALVFQRLAEEPLDGLANGPGGTAWAETGSRPLLSSE